MYGPQGEKYRRQDTGVRSQESAGQEHGESNGVLRNGGIEEMECWGCRRQCFPAARKIYSLNRVEMLCGPDSCVQCYDTGYRRK